METSERRVLVTDDDPLVCALMTQLLDHSGFKVEAVHTGQDAIDRVKAGFRGVVVLDVLLPDLEGPQVFEQIRAVAPDLPVVFLTGYGTTDMALNSIRSGAFDFMDKSNLTERLAPAVQSAFESLENVTEPRTGPGGERRDPFATMVTRSPEMRTVFRSVQNALDSKVTVLIRGESGTGKELVAQAIHANGPRREGPFITVNCASIPESLLEAELFGYERGAFTGANARKLGRFELANRGTLFLDEIGELMPALQAKLLRVLQERQFQRLGGVQTLRADVRILSATNRDLEEEVTAGRFREDLYYRLAVFTVHLPPLRHRTGDTELLVRHFVEVLGERENKPIDEIDHRAMELFCSYSWPGNVRELENVVSYALVSAKGRVMTIADLPPHFLRAVALERDGGETAGADSSGGGSGRPSALAGGGGGLRVPAASLGYGGAATWELDQFPSLAQVEAQHIQAALSASGDNKSRAARLLGISRTTLYRKLDELHAQLGEPAPE